MADEITLVSIPFDPLSEDEISELLAPWSDSSLTPVSTANRFLQSLLSDPKRCRFLQPTSDSKFRAINLLSRLEADNSTLLTRIESLESSLQSLLSSTSDECYAHGGKKDTARDAAKECLNDLTYLDRLHTLANRND